MGMMNRRNIVKREELLHMTREQGRWTESSFNERGSGSCRFLVAGIEYVARRAVTKGGEVRYVRIELAKGGRSLNPSEISKLVRHVSRSDRRLEGREKPQEDIAVYEHEWKALLTLYVEQPGKRKITHAVLAAAVSTLDQEARASLSGVMRTLVKLFEKS